MRKEVVAENCDPLLSQLEWRRIKAALPPRFAARVRSRKQDYRRFIEGVLWIACNQAFWSDLPGAYGSWRSVYVRHLRWCSTGMWDIVIASLNSDNASGRALELLLRQQTRAKNRRGLREQRQASNGSASSTPAK